MGPISSSPHLRSVPDRNRALAPEPDITVRFTSAAGLAAYTRRPFNSFRWVGPGTLRIDEAGLVVSARRLGLFGLRPVRHFIPRGEIRDVYREANAIQIHLRGPREPFFRFWADDSAAAAAIVSRLPTEHTIEFETALQEPEARSSWKISAAWLVALLLSVAAGLGWVLVNRERIRTPAISASRTTAKPAVQQPIEAVQSFTSADATLAEAELHRYLRRITTLSGEFGSAFDSLMLGTLSQPDFIEGIERWLLPQWEALAVRFRQDRANPEALGRGPAQTMADEEIKAVIDDWQLALKSYRDDLRARRTVVSAFDYMRRADAHQARLETLLERLERQRAHHE